MAGVALGDIDAHFAWQAWHLRHWAGSGGAPGSQMTPWTPRLFAWQAWHLVTSTVTLRGRRGTWRHGPSLCVAGVALGDMYLHFAWHLVTSTLTLRGRRGTYGTGLALTPSLTHHFVTHTIFHTPSFTHHLSHTTLSHTIFDTLSHTIFHTPLCHTPSLSHTIFHTQLCHTPCFATPSFTHHFVTHHLSHTIFDTPSFTHHL